MSTKRSLMILALLVGISGLLGLCAIGVWCQYAQATIMRKRIHDVLTLSKVYLELVQTNPVPSMDVLMSTLSRRGVALNNPIPRVLSQCSYRISPPVGTNGPPFSPDMVLIEETDNVMDEKRVVRAYWDGSIRVEQRR